MNKLKQQDIESLSKQDKIKVDKEKKHQEEFEKMKKAASMSLKNS